MTTELDAMLRQQGAVQTSCAFRISLEHLHNERITKEKWRLLLPTVEVQQFHKALHIFFTIAQMAEHSHQRLHDIGNPSLRILNLGRIPTMRPNGRQRSPLICLTKCGLVNGSFATIRDIYPFTTAHRAKHSQ
ncbi:uncharacterized protein N7473_008664 [Penicillium subrubescens]|uniref:uncharacterized protein n=1 Tax=Penicillium subrubescens TaxID=1316194 RepID=UPI002544DB46|nr:uncharacterized protein N7473_008664 [Penicillium subrubescens]KAJ5885990.1 hypothetical protein N7473_008664 [Penicillium subrubescens]